MAAKVSGAMKKVSKKGEQRLRRKGRVRTLVRGTAERPRLSVFRSSRHVSAQLIDDGAGVTLISASDLEMTGSKSKNKAVATLLARAGWVGQRLAEKAKTKNIFTARFDRGPYQYHGLVRAVAEGARRGGLKF